jgi:hypothetical protein
MYYYLRNRTHPAISMQDMLTNICNRVPITDATINNIILSFYETQFIIFKIILPL